MEHKKSGAIITAVAKPLIKKGIGAWQKELLLGHVQRLTPRAVAAKKRFAELRLAAEFGEPKKRVQKARGILIQQELKGLETTAFSLMQAEKVRGLREKGYYIPPHIEQIAGSRNALAREKAKLEYDLAHPAKPRNYIEKEELADEQAEEKKELRIIKILLWEEKI